MGGRGIILKGRLRLGAGGRVRVPSTSACWECFGAGPTSTILTSVLHEIDADARTQITERASAAALRTAARANGMTTMSQHGLAKALLGDTTVDEVLRVAL
jgi:type II secretory ATPase GspE/PulE/Tfp pilus assembly ATPase PilB-like protein